MHFHKLFFFFPDGIFSSRNDFVYYLLFLSISDHIVSAGKNFHQGSQHCVYISLSKN